MTDRAPDSQETAQPEGLGGGPVTLRIVFDGGDRVGKSDAVQYLAAANNTTVETISDDGGETRFSWLSFSAGWFEGNPLRLEVIASATSLTPADHKRLIELTDAVVLIAESESDGVEEAAKLLALHKSYKRPAEEQSAMVIFGFRDDTSDPASAPEILDGLSLSQDFPFAMTGPDGSGVRFGFALAVRLALGRLRERDSNGAARGSAMSSRELLAALRPGPNESRKDLGSGSMTASRTDRPIDPRSEPSVQTPTPPPRPSTAAAQVPRPAPRPSTPPVKAPSPPAKTSTPPAQVPSPAPRTPRPTAKTPRPPVKTPTVSAKPPKPPQQVATSGSGRAAPDRAAPVKPASPSEREPEPDVAADASSAAPRPTHRGRPPSVPPAVKRTPPNPKRLQGQTERSTGQRDEPGNSNSFGTPTPSGSSSPRATPESSDQSAALSSWSTPTRIERTGPRSEVVQAETNVGFSSNSKLGLALVAALLVVALVLVVFVII